MREAKNISQRQKIERSIEAIDKLQQNYEKLVGDFNEIIGNISEQFAQNVETLNAIVGILGVEKVAEVVKTERAARAQADADAKKATVEALAKENKVVSAATIDVASLVVGREVDKDGLVTPPGYISVVMENASPAFKKKAIGAKVGDKIEAIPGKFFEVTEIYQFVPMAMSQSPVEATSAPVSSTIVSDSTPS